MSRFAYHGDQCSCFDCSYKRHESEERFRRVESVMAMHRAKFLRNRPISVITDHDPGDEA